MNLTLRFKSGHILLKFDKDKKKFKHLGFSVNSITFFVARFFGAYFRNKVCSDSFIGTPLLTCVLEIKTWDNLRIAHAIAFFTFVCFVVAEM